jgi:2-dehydropantoate 2-reductase
MTTKIMNIENLNVAIFGAGAMGTTLGAFLSKGGLKNVCLIARNPNHVNALKQKGATVVCKADNTCLSVPVTALFPEEMQGKYDVVFLMTKQRNNAEILAFLKDCLSPDGIVCTTQNGLPEESVASVIGAEKTYGAVVSFGANFVGEGVVELTSSLSAMSLRCGGYRNDNSKNELLASIPSVLGLPKPVRNSASTMTLNRFFPESMFFFPYSCASMAVLLLLL